MNGSENKDNIENSEQPQPSPGNSAKKLLLALLGVFIVVCAVERPWEEFRRIAPPTPQTRIKMGAEAPDFTLQDKSGKEIRLSAVHNRQPLALWFYSPT